MPHEISLFGVSPSGTFTRDATLQGVTFALGASAGTPENTGVVVSRSDSSIAYLGGRVADFWDSYPGNRFTTTFSITDSNKERGQGGKVLFRTDAASFDIRMMMQGYPTQFTLLVDGERVDTALPAFPADGSLRWLHVDLAQTDKATGWKTVELEFNGGANLGGIALPPGSTIQPAETGGPRALFLGDSITEGGGSNSAAEDWVSIVARNLGIRDFWQSGTGGTGYERPLNERYALIDRIAADGVSADADIYVIAMGINDLTDISDGAASVFQALTSAHPTARIIAVTSWNPVAPSGTVKPVSDAGIRAAAALFPQVTVIDASDLSYKKDDPVHPDADGHWTIAEWLAPQIARAFQADGLIDEDVAGDVVGPLFIPDFDPAATYTYQVLEGGAPSTRFEIVDSGDAFPVLRLMSGIAITDPGSVTLTVTASHGVGQTQQGTITFAVRPHVQGGPGPDSLGGPATALRLSGLGGADSLTGTAGPDLLLGSDGNDLLDGRGGPDTMIGGAQDDSYTVDHVADLVVELPGEGLDRLLSRVEGYSLAPQVEYLTLADTVLTGGGNDQDNWIYGNALANKLVGNAGNDTIYGRAGNDQLFGDDGNDYLAGGPEIDTMTGGAGDDQYLIEDVGDVVIEASNRGNDLAISSIASYALPNNVERLRLSGTALNGTGNALANILTGNGLANALSGLGGGDTLYGKEGDDRLDGGAGSDWLYGDAGSDTAVYGSAFSGFTVKVGTALVVVTDKLSGDIDRLYGMEFLDFAGTRYAIDYASQTLVLG